MRRWHIVAVAVVCALVGAGVYLASTSARYDASADVVTSSSSLVSTLFQTGGGPSADPERDVNTNLEVISSATVAERVRAQLHLHTPIPQLLAAVSAATKGTSNVITITARDPQPLRAAALANAFATQYIGYETETTRAQFSQAARSIRQRLDLMGGAERSSAEGRALNQRLQEVLVAGGVNTSGVRLLDRATPPTSPAVPRTKLILTLALLVGLLIGSACAAGLAMFADPAFRE
jgi:receptor protein-tyrosine kinase